MEYLNKIKAWVDGDWKKALVVGFIVFVALRVVFGLITGS